MREKIYNILKLVLGFLFFFYFGDIVVNLLKLVGIKVEDLSNLGTVIYQFVISTFMFGFLLIIYFKNIKSDFLSFKKQVEKNIRYIIKMFFIFMITKYVVSVLSVIIMTVCGFDTSSMTSVNQNLIEMYVKASPVLMFLSAAVLAPMYEEILFRIGIGKVIRNKFLFVIISGFIFGFMHVFPLEEGISLTLGLMQSITYVTMGIFLAYVYSKTGNIFMSIGLHFLNNLLSILTMINML